MPVDPEIVGNSVSPIEYHVDWRKTTNYAAAVGDDNPRYLDDTCNGGLLAPPMFAVAATWPVMERMRSELALRLPPEAIPTMVHASEQLIFHRPIRPGNTLYIGAKLGAVWPTKAGTLIVVELSAKDEKDRKVFTEYSGAILRGIACDGEGKSFPDLPRLSDMPVPVNPEWEYMMHVAATATYLYDGCSDIVFPIHTSVGFAKAVGLPGIILQGTAALAMAAAQIVDRYCERKPERFLQLACRFTGVILPGSDIRLLTKSSGNKVCFGLQNAKGKTALCGECLLSSSDRQ